MFLSACDPTQTVKLISPNIPAELLEPVPKPDRDATSLRDFGLLLVDYDEALTEANSKIDATGVIVTEFKKRIAEPQ